MRKDFATSRLCDRRRLCDFATFSFRPWRLLFECVCVCVQVAFGAWSLASNRSWSVEFGDGCWSLQLAMTLELAKLDLLFVELSESLDDKVGYAEEKRFGRL